MTTFQQVAEQKKKLRVEVINEDKLQLRYVHE